MWLATGAAAGRAHQRRGVDKIKIVADLLRHDSSRTTERYYIKKVQEMRRRAAASASAGMPSYHTYSTEPESQA